jgi:hypothetical protein
MTAEELEDAVLGIVQDDSFADVVLDYINQGRGEIAGLVDLPALDTVATVNTTASASSVALPTNYHKGLYWVGSAVQKIRIGAGKDDYHNLLAFLENHPVLTQVGLVEDVVIQGVNLLYQGMSADTLTLRYYKAPTTLVLAADVPAELPSHLHKPLLVSYACKEIYNEIEDGIEGGTPNTDKYDRLFQRALATLSSWCLESKPREPKYVRDMNAF